MQACKRREAHASPCKPHLPDLPHPGHARVVDQGLKCGRVKEQAVLVACGVVVGRQELREVFRLA